MAAIFPVSLAPTPADCVRLLGLSLLVGAVAGMLSVRGAGRVDPAVAFANS